MKAAGAPKALSEARDSDRSSHGDREGAFQPVEALSDSKLTVAP